MTLFRQLMLGLAGLFALLATGIEAIYVANAGSNLREQMSAHSQDAATALALALAPALTADDPVLADTVVGALFDSGYYREIMVSDDRGQILAQRRLPLAPAGVPGWFADLVPLDAAPGQAPIAAGWRDAGRVSVAGHPEFAYRQLWHATTAALTWLVLLFGVSCALAALFLRGILRPLRDIEQAAASIGAGRCGSIATRPKAPELRRIVTAINTLSADVRKMAERETRGAEARRRLAHIDPVSGLHTRRGFEHQVEDAHRNATAAEGALFMIELGDFKAYVARNGPRRADELISTCGAYLGQPGAGRSCAGRVGNNTFALHVLEIDRTAAADLAHTICRELAGLLVAGDFHDATFRCGAAHFTRHTALPALLAQAYQAMVWSRQNGAGAGACDQNACPSPSRESAPPGYRICAPVVP